MKKYLIYFHSISIVVLMLFSCERSAETDDIKPEAEMLFPQSCDTLHLGESFTLKAVLSDNRELAAFIVDIHYNFDQHGHSTEPETCPMDNKKEADNDFEYSRSYQIPSGLTSYTTDVAIDIPGDSDPGDYHLQVTAIDKEGWSNFIIIAVKILE